MMNKKGFTMVELLATIVILGILSTIGIVAVVNIRQNEIEKFNNHQKEVFKQAGKSYFTDNKSRLPYTPMGIKKVTLQELINENYLDSLLNYEKETYDLDSYVLVRFLGNGKYAYISSLMDGGEEIPDNDPNSGTISYAFIDFIRTEETNHYTNKKSKVRVTMNDEDYIAAYKYTITNTSNKRKKESEYIFVNSENKKTITDSIYIDPKEFEDGIYKITIELWDMKGYKTIYKGKAASSSNINLIYIDTTAPTCKISVLSDSLSNGFYQSPATIKLDLTDDVSGILEYDLSTNENPSSYNKKLSGTQSSTSGITWYGTVKDKTGNVGKCNSGVIKVGTPKLCERAKTLHTEICDYSDEGCHNKYGERATVTFGSLGTQGVLTSGDAFTCDVNGDGNYDEEKERFYYVTDLDSDTAVLFYYSNVKAGEPAPFKGYLYNSKYVDLRTYGPLTAMEQLPTTKQWSKVSLKSTKRNITDEKGTIRIKGFNYAGYAARLLTFQEVVKACNITVESDYEPYSRGEIGELDNCEYLMENTTFSAYSIGKNNPFLIWLENSVYPWTQGEYSTDWTYINAWGIFPDSRTVRSTSSATPGLYLGVDDTLYEDVFNCGVRPAIEVAKTDISY